MKDFGDLRSALHSGTEHILSLPQPEHVWNYIRSHLEITPQTVTWKVWGENDPKPLDAPSSEGWKLSIGSLVLATGLTFDLIQCSHEWSTVPALEVLPIWISWADDALKRGEITQENHDAPLVAIEAKKAWCRGEISDSDLGKASAAAYDAYGDAADAAARDAWAAGADAAWAAARAAWATADAAAANAGYASSASGADAASRAARASRAASRAASRDARAATWERYDEEFCQYVLDSIMKETK